MEHLVGLAELKSGAMAKRVSTIIIFIVVVLLTSAQTTQSMKEDHQETIPQYSYTEKELEKVSAYILVELFQEESMVVNTHRKNYCKE